MANGQSCTRFACDLGPPFDPCPQHFKGPGGWQSPGNTAVIYHATDLEVLWQGVVPDGGLWTPHYGHAGRFGVFGHGQPGTAYCCLGSARTECFFELTCNFVRSMRGGMHNWYFAPGAPNMLNKHCKLSAVWAPEASIMPMLLGAEAPCPPPPPPQDPWNCCAGETGKVAWTYQGRELNERRRDREHGYLTAVKGEEVKALSDPAPGHAGNMFREYVFAEALQTGHQGWFPTALLNPARACEKWPGWALVTGLKSPKGRGMNGHVLPVEGRRQDGRLLLRSPSGLAAVSQQNCHVFSSAEMAEPGLRKRLLLRGHPDKGAGDRSLFDLAMLLV